MSSEDPRNLGGKKLGAVRRRAVNVSQEELVKVAYLQPGQSLPLVIQPAVDGLNLSKWATGNREFVENQLLKHGGILFRDFDIRSVDEFEQFIMAYSGGLLEYTHRSTPRSQVSGNIYTSTEYPADQSIPLHNEMSYTSEWPLKIWFFCVQAAEQEGETPIADSRKIFERIDPEIRARFMQKNVMYVRNYSPTVDLPWQDVFQTSDKSEVEDFCRRAGIEFEWKDDDGLRTRQVCQSVATHPRTGEMVWFNQAHLFHVSRLQPEVREALLSMFVEEDLPRNTFYGDGTPIEPSVIAEIDEVHEQEAIAFPWHEGDLLMLDNMLTAHGRRPFVGSRKIVVGMAESFSAGSS